MELHETQDGPATLGSLYSAAVLASSPSPGRVASAAPRHADGSVDPVAIVGASGALGFGLAVRLGWAEMARITESLTALMIAVKVRHTTHAGIRLTGLPDILWE